MIVVCMTHSKNKVLEVGRQVTYIHMLNAEGHLIGHSNVWVEVLSTIDIRKLVMRCEFSLFRSRKVIIPCIHFSNEICIDARNQTGLKWADRQAGSKAEVSSAKYI